MRRIRPPGPLWPPIGVLAAAYLTGTAAGVLLGGAWWLTVAAGATFALAALLARLAPASMAILVAAIALAGADTHAGRHTRRAHRRPSPPSPACTRWPARRGRTPRSVARSRGSTST